MAYDQGREMAAHQQLTFDSGVKVYFADPHSPWQRGINENTNGLLRQYLPKGSDLSGFAQDELDEIARKLNTRPRKSLGFKCPAELFTPDAFDFKQHHVALLCTWGLKPPYVVKHYVHALKPEQQLLKIFRRLDLTASAKPFSLCLECNAPLRPITKAEVLERLSERVREQHERFATCDVCRRVFWEGSHWRRMRTLLATVMGREI